MALFRSTKNKSGKENPAPRALCEAHGEENCVRCVMAAMEDPVCSQAMIEADLVRVLSSIDERLLKLTERYRGQVILAGGYIRAVLNGDSIKDIDLFTSDRETALDLANAMKHSNITLRSMGDVEYANHGVTIRWAPSEGIPPTQIAFGWEFKPGNAWSLLEHFDFTISRAAIWAEKESWRGLCDARFYADIAARRLVYTGKTDFPGDNSGGSIMRMLKFVAQGYTVPLDSLASILAYGLWKIPTIAAHHSAAGLEQEIFSHVLGAPRDAAVLKVTEPSISDIRKKEEAERKSRTRQRADDGWSS